MTSDLRVVCWSFGHATREIPIPAALGAAFGALAPQVLILNEIKDGPSKAALRVGLARHGLPHCLVSAARKGLNQVLIASAVNRPRPIRTLLDVRSKGVGLW